jgi:predicted ester cyclase
MRYAVLGLMLVLSVTCPGDGLSTEESIRMSNNAHHLARIRGLLVAFNRQDVAATMAHFDAAVTWNRGDGAPLRGREALAEHLREFFRAFPDASLSDVKFLAIEPDAVVVEWVLSATHLGDWHAPGRREPIFATGRTVHMVGADVLRFSAAGGVVSDDARADTAGFLSQLGVVSAPPLDAAHIRDLAARYTAAWGSQKAAGVASFYSEGGNLRVNAGAPAVGRTAITATAQGFMSDFPDMRVIMDGLDIQGDRAVYRWTLIGTNTGPGGTGKRVRFSGFEVWQLGPDGLIAESRGHYDSGAYQYQLRHGAEER